MTNMSTCRLSFVVEMPVFLLLWATLRYRSHQPAATDVHGSRGNLRKFDESTQVCLREFCKCVGLLKILIFVFDKVIVL